MKVIIFGATGGTGQELIKQCLENHHTVSVFVRNPDKLVQFRNDVKVFTGDVLDISAVEKAVEGQDAVLAIRPVPERIMFYRKHTVQLFNKKDWISLQDWLLALGHVPLR